MEFIFFVLCIIIIIIVNLILILQFSIGGHAHGYIISQGPLENTTGEFWQMIWEQNIQIILMLTNEYVCYYYDIITLHALI